MKKITKILLTLILAVSVFTMTPVFAEPTATPTAEPTVETTVEPVEETATPEVSIEPTEEATATPEVTETPEVTATPTVEETAAAAAPAAMPVVYGVTPRAGLVETPMNSVKTATDIGNGDYEIKFSFPGQQSTVTPTVDVMIVMDKSSIADMTAFKAALVNMVNALAANTSVNYKVGVIMFDNRVIDVTGGLLDLNVPANVTAITNGIQNVSGTWGTTLIGGVEVGKRYLDADTSVPAENKFFILSTDFGGYLEYSDAYNADTSGGLFYMYNYDAGTNTAASRGNGDVGDRSACTSVTSADVANLVDNGVLLNGQPVSNINWLSDAGEDSSFSYLLGTDISGKYTAGKNIIPLSAIGLPTTPIGWEHTIYRVGQMLEDMDNSGYHLEAITTLYHPENAHTLSISQAVGDWWQDSFGNRYDVNSGSAAATAAVANITNDILYLIQKGTLYDYVNTATFDLKADSFKVTVGGVEQTRTVTPTGYGFGTAVAGVYPYEIITDGTSTVQLNINTKVSVEQQVELTFIETVKPGTVDGTYNTNTGDVHLEFMNTSEFNADPNTYTMRHTYSSPSVRIGGTAPVVPPAPSRNLVTYLDCSGNTVKIEWVDYKGSSTAPGYGLTYDNATNVTTDLVLSPTNCTYNPNGYKVPNTASK